MKKLYLVSMPRDLFSTRAYSKGKRVNPVGRRSIMAQVNSINGNSQPKTEENFNLPFVALFPGNSDPNMGAYFEYHFYGGVAVCRGAIRQDVIKQMRGHYRGAEINGTSLSDFIRIAEEEPRSLELGVDSAYLVPQESIRGVILCDPPALFAATVRELEKNYKLHRVRIENQEGIK